MKISEYIKKLEEIKAVHGDLPVYYMGQDDDEIENPGPAYRPAEGEPTDFWHLPERVQA